MARLLFIPVSDTILSGRSMSEKEDKEGYGYSNDCVNRKRHHERIKMLKTVKT